MKLKKWYLDSVSKKFSHKIDFVLDENFRSLPATKSACANERKFSSSQNRFYVRQVSFYGIRTSKNAQIEILGPRPEIWKLALFSVLARFLKCQKKSDFWLARHLIGIFGGNFWKLWWKSAKNPHFQESTISRHLPRGPKKCVFGLIFRVLVPAFCDVHIVSELNENHFFNNLVVGTHHSIKPFCSIVHSTKNFSDIRNNTCGGIGKIFLVELTITKWVDRMVRPSSPRCFKNECHLIF